MESNPPLYLQGMHGMGDNIHQRAIIRQLLDTRDVWLETSWPCVYHDFMPSGRLHLRRRRVILRTQTKNAEREQAKFGGPPVPPGTKTIRLSYTGTQVLRTPGNTILETMFRNMNLPDLDYGSADFRLPIPDAWYAEADKLLERLQPTKPVLIYRPLVVRGEWRGAERRNANPFAYTEIFSAIRDRFFVISLADLVPGREWMIGPILKADAAFHNGELPFETMAALFSRAKMVYTSSGFATLLAQAVSTPNVSVIGLYERIVHHGAGAGYAPFLGIEPIKPCHCQMSLCNIRTCSKDIDIPAAIEKIISFADALSTTGEKRVLSEVYDPAPVSKILMPPRRIVRGPQPTAIQRAMTQAEMDAAAMNRSQRVAAQQIRRAQMYPKGQTA